VRLYEKTQILKEIFLETLDRKTDIYVPKYFLPYTKKCINLEQHCRLCIQGIPCKLYYVNYKIYYW